MLCFKYVDKHRYMAVVPYKVLFRKSSRTFTLFLSDADMYVNGRARGTR